MADTNDTNVVPSGPEGNFFPQDFSLEDVNIITNSGQTFRLKFLFTELSFFEDIYSFSVSGYINIRDSSGLIEKLRLNGDEYLELTYSKAGGQDDNYKNKRKYRIYKIGNRKPIGNLDSEFYTLFFCSEFLMLSEQTKITKSFPGKKIATETNTTDGIINHILYEELKVPSDKIEKIEETYGLYDFIVPLLKPFEAISWLSNYARPSDGYQGADMLFFETKDGFNYRSLRSMFKEDVYGTYRYIPKNLDPDYLNNAFGVAVTTVLDIEHTKTYDVLNAISSGTFANQLISIDPVTRRQKVTNLSYDDLEDEKVNGYGITTPLVNKLGVSQTKAYSSSVKFLVGNSDQNDIEAIRSNPGAVAKDIYVETYVPYRTSQINLANYTILKILIPGDSAITAGRTIELNIYSLSYSEKKREFDPYLSGKYLVVAVRHIIQPQGTYQTVLEIAKQSVKQNYITPDETSSVYQRVMSEI